MRLFGVTLAAVTFAGVVGPAFAQEDYDTEPKAQGSLSIEDMRAVWPSAARGSPGSAKVTCLITAEGVVKDCQVAEETPAGKGFGAAALLLAPTITFRPATKAGRPVPVRVTLPIRWQGTAWTGSDNYRMVNTLPWTRTPSQADLLGAYPKSALSKGLAGHAVLRCGVRPEGRLRSCEVISQEPKNSGFGPTAERLSELFEVPVSKDDLKALLTLRVNVPVHFMPPAATAQVRYITKIDWTRSLDPKKVVEVFPGKAADAGLVTGRAVVDCALDANGQLNSCVVASENPAGMNFGRAAVQVAQVLAVNPWGEDGLPVEGSHIRFAIRLNQKEPEPAAPTGGR